MAPLARTDSSIDHDIDRRLSATVIAYIQFCEEFLNFLELSSDVLYSQEALELSNDLMYNQNVSGELLENQLRVIGDLINIIDEVLGLVRMDSL